jgi:hypothetical protein
MFYQKKWGELPRLKKNPAELLSIAETIITNRKKFKSFLSNIKTAVTGLFPRGTPSLAKANLKLPSGKSKKKPAWT